MQWQAFASVVCLLFIVTVQGVEPQEERMGLQLNREMVKDKKRLIAKLLAGLLDVDDNLLESVIAPLGLSKEEGTDFEERSAAGEIPPRKPKAGCKLFFWKTFSHC
ncbi:somatostatin-1B-like [Callorhinchus milii]|nr:somatostatin-1B-like [Callorhinchus milii]|eukprot:gi/632968108/ref/XP_007900347.1/ PREDICTED: somatostatin-1B-like [Callorhinchus milii]